MVNFVKRNYTVVQLCEGTVIDIIEKKREERVDMNVNEIIRQKRIEQGLTQEQVASRLGVSAPAVNKWEKGNSYPDITLLPALARLLNTDLNTLLSFQESLTIKEINEFLNTVYLVSEADGIEAAFLLAMNKVREYSSCDILLLNVAIALDGLILLHTEGSDNEHYCTAIEDLYLRAAKSQEPRVQNPAKTMLISKYIAQCEYEKAETIINELPDETTTAKKQLQTNLYMALGNLDKAAQLTENKLVHDTGQVQASLFTLMEIALKENRMEDAKKIAHVANQLTTLFDLWEYGAYVADFELSVAQKDAAGCLASLKKMLPAMQENWKPSKSPLYRHIPGKEETWTLGERLLPKILQELDDPGDSKYDFLRRDPQTQTYITNFKTRNNIE